MEFSDMLSFGFPMAMSVLSLLFFYLIGSYIEQDHLEKLEAREKELGLMLVTDLKSYAPGTDAQMLTGEVVLAADAFKRWLLSYRALFGGEAKSYRLLLERARREALLRLLEQAKARGHNAVCNVRFDSSDISGGQASGNQGGGMVIIMISGTSYRVDRVPQVHMPLADFAMGLPTHA